MLHSAQSIRGWLLGLACTNASHVHFMCVLDGSEIKKKTHADLAQTSVQILINIDVREHTHHTCVHCSSAPSIRTFFLFFFLLHSCINHIAIAYRETVATQHTHTLVAAPNFHSRVVVASALAAQEIKPCHKIHLHMFSQATTMNLSNRLPWHIEYVCQCRLGCDCGHFENIGRQSG